MYNRPNVIFQRYQQRKKYRDNNADLSIFQQHNLCKQYIKFICRMIMRCEKFKTKKNLSLFFCVSPERDLGNVTTLKNLLNPTLLSHAKKLTICWWNSNLPHNFLTKFKFRVSDFIIVLSILFFFGFSEQIFIEMKGGENMSEEKI